MKMSLNELKSKIIIEDFFDSEGNIKIELLNDTGNNNVKETAYILSEKIEDPSARDRRKSVLSSDLKINQVRKFYDAFLNVFNSKKIPMNEKKVKLLMLKSNAEYSANRLKVSTLEMFIKNRLDLVLLQKSEKDFNNYLNAFKLHFEALVGYFPKNQ